MEKLSKGSIVVCVDTDLSVAGYNYPSGCSYEIIKESNRPTEDIVKDMFNGVDADEFVLLNDFESEFYSEHYDLIKMDYKNNIIYYYKDYDYSDDAKPTKVLCFDYYYTNQDERFFD